MKYTIDDHIGDELTFILEEDKWIKVFHGTNYIHSFYVEDIDNIVTVLLALQNELKLTNKK